MAIPGLLVKNAKEVDEQYREIEGIVSIEGIEKLMKVYDIGKAPLSLALGFGEITITRYLEGQVPSHEYSNIIKKALTSPSFMKEKLNENKNKLTNTAYRKAIRSAENVEKLFSVSDKMLDVISYIFEKQEEVTPLELQKLLYYIQGIFLSIYRRPIFEEDCQAWVHGPVYSDVYYLFNDFLYNPIDDPRFALLEGIADNLSNDEKATINLVLNTFGMYVGKILERITHKEDPWIEARKGLEKDERSNEIISKEDIRKYFKKVDQKYNIRSEAGLKAYISKNI